MPPLAKYPKNDFLFADIKALFTIPRRLPLNGISEEAPCIFTFEESFPICHVDRHRPKPDEIKEERESLKSPRLRGISFAIDFVAHFLR